MPVKNLNDIIVTLKKNKPFFRDQFGVVRIGVFGSFVDGRQTSTSDIDIVIEMTKEKKNLHNYLKLKKLLESEFNRSVDLGFEHTLKPAVVEKLKGKIVYV
jgi:predicted nucleotidyltransferase